MSKELKDGTKMTKYVAIFVLTGIHMFPYGFSRLVKML